MDEQKQKLLVSIAEDLVNAFQNRLTYEHGYFTGALSQSIGNYKVKEGGISFFFEDYAEYLEYGTPNPTTPSQIMRWVERKIIPKLRGKKAKINKQKIAESLAKHITKFGPRPFPFIRLTLTQDLPRILTKHGL